MQVFTHGHGGDQVVGRLQNEYRGGQAEHILAVIREEGHAGELLGDVRLGAAEALGERLAQVRLRRGAHDHRGHGAGPAQVVAVEGVEQVVDVVALETADIFLGIDIAWRWANHHVCGNAAREETVGEGADHRADRVAHQNHRALGVGVDNLVQVMGIAIQAAVFGFVERTQVRQAGADQVIQHHAKAFEKVRCQGIPHGLVATKAVGKHQRRGTVAHHMYMVSVT